jgi:site-specific DNA-methyltransferase (adenine-specific)
MDCVEQNGHKLVNADVFDGLSLVKDHSVGLIFIDPPYNIGKDFKITKDKWETDEAYLSWAFKWLDLCIAKLKNNGSLYFMASTQCMPYFDLYLRKKIKILSRIVWHYDSSGVQARKYYGSLYEPILFCVKNENDYCFNAQDIMVEAKTGAKRKLIDYRKAVPTVYNSKKVPGNVWEFPRVRYRMGEYENHPSQKPVALLERIIKASSNEGDLVLDPFSGTFTTSYVCEQLDRKSIGIEICPDYYHIGLRRVFGINDYEGMSIRREPKIYEGSNEVVTGDLFAGVLA